jgi:hypothetical protein
MKSRNQRCRIADMVLYHVMMEWDLDEPAGSELEEELRDLADDYTSVSDGGSGAGLGYRDFHLIFGDKSEARDFAREAKDVAHQVRVRSFRVKMEKEVDESYDYDDYM